MSYAEQAEAKFTRLIVENRHGPFSKYEKSNRGEDIVVKFVWNSDEPISPKLIAQHLHLSSARVAAILGSLEKKGLIVRNMSATDRRRITVTLTEKGQAEAQAKVQRMKKRMIKVFEEMGEEDTEQFIQLMTKFMEIAKKLPPEKEGSH